MSQRRKRLQETDCGCGPVNKKSINLNDEIAKPEGDYKQDASSNLTINDIKQVDIVNDAKHASDTIVHRASQHEDLSGGPARLRSSFFDKPCIKLAQDLLGKRVVRLVDGQRISGRIVETEAYLGYEDKASHSYNGKRTDRNEAMFMSPGTCYVYNIYGMYCCFNISSHGEGAAVLLRALEVTEGAETMRIIRSKGKSKAVKDKDLANGPSKLCQALKINKTQYNKADLTSSPTLWLEQDKEADTITVVTSPRINISYGEEWVDKPLRFYVLGNPAVSVRNKECEAKCDCDT